MDAVTDLKAYKRSYDESEFGRSTRMYRTYSYLREKKSTSTQVIYTVSIASNIFGWGGIGFKTGGAIGGPQGAVVGGLGGATFGAGMAIYMSVKNSEKSAEYTQWASEKVHNNIYDAYLEILEKDWMLSEGCTCFLSNDFVQNAIIAPDGQLYDREYLSLYFRSKNVKTDFMRRFASPINPEHYFIFTECQTMPQIDLFVLKRTEYILNSHLQLLEKQNSYDARQIYQSLLNIKSKLPQQIKEKYDKCILQITDLNDEDILDDHQMMEAKKQFHSFFGRGATADIFSDKTEEELKAFHAYILSGPRPQSFNPNIYRLEKPEIHSTNPPRKVMYKYYPH